MDDQRPRKRGFHFLADVGVRAQQARIVRGDIDCPNYGTAPFNPTRTGPRGPPGLASRGAPDCPNDGTARCNAMRTGTRGRQDRVERVAQAAPFSADLPGAQPEEVV